MLLWCFLITGSTYADDSHAPVNLSPVGVDRIGSASLSTLNLSIDLSNSYGKGYFFTAPANREEQLINQGYASLNVFHYVDAYRSFKSAYDLNHKSIYALIGMSFSVLTQDSSSAGAKLASVAINEADKISKLSNTTDKEKAWLAFSKAFYLMKIGSVNLLDDKDTENAGNAFQNLSIIDGDNLEFKTFAHWILLDNSNFQYIKSVLQSVLNIEPNHAGAHHYLLHISEMIDDIATAQAHGEELILLALGSAHAQHMYGHTLPQTGEWNKALKQFLIADGIHQKWASSNNVDISEDWHYAHNLDLLAATYLGLGDYQSALNNWSKSMRYDARAIQKMIGLALATDQLLLAQSSLTQIESMGPQYRNFVSFLRSEEEFLSSNVVPTNFPETPYGSILKKVYQSVGDEDALSLEFSRYFEAKFSSGGFDGWSNGFVELMRAKNIASKLNLTTLVETLAALEVRARTGKFCTSGVKQVLEVILPAS